MIEKTDREIEDDLLDVLAAAMFFIQTKGQENPFVRKLGSSVDEKKAFQILVNCVENASYLTPQIEALLKEREEEKQVSRD